MFGQFPIPPTIWTPPFIRNQRVGTDSKLTGYISNAKTLPESYNQKLFIFLQYFDRKHKYSLVVALEIVKIIFRQNVQQNPSQSRVRLSYQTHLR